MKNTTPDPLRRVFYWVLNMSQASKAMAKAIIDAAAPEFKYRTDEWMLFLCQDVLAGFGRNLDTPWDEYRLEKIRTLTALYAQLVIENPFSDVLGETYMEMVTGNKYLGQFFTPKPLATMCAQTTFNTIKQNGIVRILEPAAGSGVMLLAACEHINKAHRALDRVAITAIDLDGLCAHMTATQLLANSYIHATIGEITVLRGDALANKDFTVIAATPRIDVTAPLTVQQEEFCLA